MQFLFRRLEGNRQSRRTGPGQKRRNDRFFDPEKQFIGIFPRENIDDQRIDDEDHQQYTEDDTACDLQIGSEKIHAVLRKIHRRQRKHADGKIFHDPVDDLETGFLCRIKNIQHGIHGSHSLAVRCTIQHHPGGDPEK